MSAFTAGDLERLADLVAARLGASGGVDGERSQLLTAEQLAARWQMSTAAVYRLARSGDVPSVPLGRYVRFRLASIESWERSQEVSDA